MRNKHHECFQSSPECNDYLFSSSESPRVPFISWFGVHFSVKLSADWWRERYPGIASKSSFCSQKQQTENEGDSSACMLFSSPLSTPSQFWDLNSSPLNVAHPVSPVGLATVRTCQAIFIWPNHTSTSRSCTTPSSIHLSLQFKKPIFTLTQLTRFSMT